MKKLLLLIILTMTNFISFSQTDTDSTSIRLETPIAKLVIKDLISGDGAKEELIISDGKFKLLKQKIILKDSIILNLNDKINNFNSIMLTKNDQLNLSQELSKKLKQDLQKQKLKTRLVGITGVAVAIGILVIAK